MASPTSATPARPFTYEDLEGMPDDGYRREIIGGSLIVNPSPLPRHQVVVSRLIGLLRLAQPAGVEALVAPLDWRAPGGDVVEPDIIVLRATDLDLDRPVALGVTPLLVVEVVSPSNPAYDRVIKRAVYEAAGVPSFWLIDPVRPSVVALRLGAGGAYAVEAEAAGEETFATTRPYPVRFRPTDLLS